MSTVTFPVYVETNREETWTVEMEWAGSPCPSVGYSWDFCSAKCDDGREYFSREKFDAYCEANGGKRDLGGLASDAVTPEDDDGLTGDFDNDLRGDL